MIQIFFRVGFEIIFVCFLSACKLDEGFDIEKRQKSFVVESSNRLLSDPLFCQMQTFLRVGSGSGFFVESWIFFKVGLYIFFFVNECL